MDKEIEAMMSPGVISAITDALQCHRIHSRFASNDELLLLGSQKLRAAIQTVLAHERRPFPLPKSASAMHVVNDNCGSLVQNHHEPYDATNTFMDLIFLKNNRSPGGSAPQLFMRASGFLLKNNRIPLRRLLCDQSVRTDTCRMD